MIVLSLICLVSGTSVVGSSLLLPAYRSQLETMGAVLFAAGLCLVGSGLPLFR